MQHEKELKQKKNGRQLFKIKNLEEVGGGRSTRNASSLTTIKNIFTVAKILPESKPLAVVITMQEDLTPYVKKLQGCN